MTDTGCLNYFLFPHMTLSSNSLENLGAFLPRLNVLEIIARARVPEGARDRIGGYVVLSEGELASRIDACLEGYRNFAKVHGGPGGILGFLRQAFDEIDEPRYRIQEELRGKLPQAKDAEEQKIVQASLFLEMARELDEKELEIESGYDRLNAIEQEFRDILGIEEEESEQVDVDLTSALAPDQTGLLYMLAKRIESWFLMFSIRPLAGAPVFVAGLPGVADEALDMIRTACEKSGKDFSTSVHTLGPLPWPGGKARGLPEEASGLVSSCSSELDAFIKSAARGEAPEKLEDMRLALQSALEELCGAEHAGATLRLTVVENVFVAAVPGLPELPLAGDAQGWPPVFLSVEPG